ncbi:MAG: hypothetical protein NTX03_10670 [Bacteroidetes bacterium]|nr:hypothetical protein [Bacteroidota bacterium]
MDITQDFKEFIELLNNNKVEYLVVGGYAVTLHGYPRYTGDIDFWIKNSPENAAKVVASLYQFGFGSVDIDEADFNKENSVVQLGFPPNRIDIITTVDGLQFDEAWEMKTVVISEGIPINYISLYHLRINKEKSGRDKDKLDLKNLPEI